MKINGWKWHTQIEQAMQLVLELSLDMHGDKRYVGVVGQYMHIVDIPEFEITPVFQGKDLHQDAS